MQREPQRFPQMFRDRVTPERQIPSGFVEKDRCNRHLAVESEVKRRREVLELE